MSVVVNIRSAKRKSKEHQTSHPPTDPPFETMVWIPGGTFIMVSNKHYMETLNIEELFKNFASYIVLGVEIIAIVLIAIGAVEAVIGLLKPKYDPLRPFAWKREVFIRLGSWLLLGLEFALAADIVRSAISPTWAQVGTELLPGQGCRALRGGNGSHGRGRGSQACNRSKGITELRSQQSKRLKTNMSGKFTCLSTSLLKESRYLGARTDCWPLITAPG
jgi:uncharacterized membrane protein